MKFRSELCILISASLTSFACLPSWVSTDRRVRFGTQASLMRNSLFGDRSQALRRKLRWRR